MMNIKFMHILCLNHMQYVIRDGPYHFNMYSLMNAAPLFYFDLILIKNAFTSFYVYDFLRRCLCVRVISILIFCGHYFVRQNKIDYR